VRAQPDERRFSFQLARAYVEANKFDLAKPQLEKLSKDDRHDLSRVPAHPRSSERPRAVSWC
jgi:hypothetical protein